MSDKAFPNLERVVEDCGCAPETLLSKARAELEAAKELLQAILCMGMECWRDTPQVSRVVSAISACQPKERE